MDSSSTMPVHVLWCSRHAMTIEQRAGLRALFGQDVNVTVDPNPFSSIEELAERFHKSGANELALVAPLGMVERLVRVTGIEPLWCEGERGPGGVGYRFKSWRRCTGVDVKLEEVEVVDRGRR